MDKVSMMEGELIAKYPDFKVHERSSSAVPIGKAIDVNGKGLYVTEAEKKVAHDVRPGISREAGRAMKQILDSSEFEHIKKLADEVVKATRKII